VLILPAIDLRNGKCVRLTQGDYGDQKIYSDDPVGVAKTFVEQGAAWIHVVDLDGAKAGQPINLAVCERIAKESGANIEFGGGVRDLDAARMVLRCGISRVILGTSLLAEPSMVRAIIEKLGDRAVAGLDVRDGRLCVSGWTQNSNVEALKLAKELESYGAKRFVVTDIATDGMLQGPNLAMIREFAEELHSPVIASGGVSSLEDLRQISGISGNVEGAIVGKALYENKFTLSEAMAAVAGPMVGY
jgi:phosphoribosylformimino-5-aminoimidazole carboxamide ribotide isomerase